MSIYVYYSASSSPEDSVYIHIYIYITIHPAERKCHVSWKFNLIYILILIIPIEEQELI